MQQPRISFMVLFGFGFKKPTYWFGSIFEACSLVRWGLIGEENGKKFGAGMVWFSDH